MKTNFSTWSIRYPLPPILLFSILCVLGIVSFIKLPITKFPNIDVPVITVLISQRGSSPAEVESQITREVEDAVAGISGIKHIQSTITDGRSMTAIEFRLEINADRALNDVKDAVANVRSTLPKSIDEPIVQRLDVENQALVSYTALSQAMTIEELSWFVDDVVVRNLQGLKGVGRVERIGGVTREVQVVLDPERLMALGITASEVNRQLTATNITLSGGKSEIGDLNQAIRTLADSGKVSALAETSIILSGNRSVRLGDIASVEDKWEEPRSFARLDGQPVVTFSVYRARGASDTVVFDQTRHKLAQMEVRYPHVSFAKVNDDVLATYGSFKSAMESLIEGSLLAVLIVFIFLRDLRATFVAAVALPLAAIPTFWAMSLAGFSLNMVSLLAVTLVTGILVDDAIVEIENIVRHMRMGKSPYRAAMEAVDEIALAVIAITLTIMAIFIPVSFMGGVVGQYFKQFGLTVGIAVFFSLIVARLMTPLMSAYLFRSSGHQEVHDGWFMRHYLACLHLTLRWRWITLLVGILFSIGAILSASQLPQGFIPPEDHSRLVLSVELPPGSKLEETTQKTDFIAKLLHEKVPELRTVFVMGGTSPTGTLELNRAAMILQFVPKKKRNRSQKELEPAIFQVLAEVPDLRYFVVNERGERELTIGVQGHDPALVRDLAMSLQSRMQQNPIFLNPTISAGSEKPEILILPRLDEASRLGITPAMISEVARIATIGDATGNLSRISLDNRQITIRVQARADLRERLGLLAALPVPTSKGTTVPLLSVADLRLGSGDSTIERYDRVRRILVGSGMAPGFSTGQGQKAFMELPEAQNMPEGVWFQPAGDTEMQAEVFIGFAQAMGSGIMIVLVLLIFLLGNIFAPLTILASLPLSIAGVVLALQLTHKPVSMPVVIGILMLMGVVTKNSIMLVDFAADLQKKGLSVRDSIIDAGRKRARPIVMTTLAMIAGMTPAALNLGEGGEFRSPMAIAVIGGLAVSTLLSLIFIPSFYTLMIDLSQMVWKLWLRCVRPNPGETEAEENPPRVS